MIRSESSTAEISKKFSWVLDFFRMLQIICIYVPQQKTICIPIWHSDSIPASIPEFNADVPDILNNLVFNLKKSIPVPSHHKLSTRI